MHEDHGFCSSAITGIQDPRIFRFGSLLRRLKIDELPQLLNVLKGEMSIVGPRPEDPRIVNQYYTPEQYETLTVLPGLASPGSIYNYTHEKQYLANEDFEKSYVERLLPVKLALERVYVREASFFYDLRIIMRTIRIILSIDLGKRHFPEPREMSCIQKVCK
jgi:lipopolysaccharide/colanic/teichoic acid biosynthesis glycosyltransferase